MEKATNDPRISDSDIGKTIEFNASRIQKGNPVKGVLKSLDDEWLEVKLLKDVEGMVNFWEKGENKSFRLSLIYGDIKIK